MPPENTSAPAQPAAPMDHHFPVATARPDTERHAAGAPATLFEAEGISVSFRVRRGAEGPKAVVHALDDVSFGVEPGATLGIVGESGCGKTTLGRVIAGLQKALSGSILVRDQSAGDARDDRGLRKRRSAVQMVFQDPWDALDPRYTVERSVAEPLRGVRGREARSRVADILRLVGLPPDVVGQRRPFQLSGGQQQRVCIARALIGEPSLLVLDEPTSSLDVSIQARILRLLGRLQSELQLTYVFISHDLSVIEAISNFVAVLYLGEIVEFGPTEAFFALPLHPYSIALRSAIPLADPRRERGRERIILAGDVPSPVNLPSGCRFHTRCPVAEAVCSTTTPPLVEYSPNHWARCHFAGAFNASLKRTTAPPGSGPEVASEWGEDS